LIIKLLGGVNFLSGKNATASISVIALNNSVYNICFASISGAFLRSTLSFDTTARVGHRVTPTTFKE
jgi:hypothetical protein